MNTSCEKLPLVDLNAPKAASHRSRAGKVSTEESVEQDQKDAHYNLGLAYIWSKDRDSALEQYEILKKLDTEKANELFDEINK